MAEITNRQFLDLAGLSRLWNKIKSTFADKTATETALNNINGSISGLSGSISTVSGKVDTLNNTVLAFAPKEADKYSDAVAASLGLVVGSIINVKNDETVSVDEKDVTYLKGLYIVTGSGKIEYLGTSSGSDEVVDIETITKRIKELEGSAVKGGVVVDENGTQLDTLQVVNNNLIIVVDNELNVDSQSLHAITHRAVAAKFKEIQNQLTVLPKFKITVVEKLPTDLISETTIYLKKNTTETDNNMYTEYIYVDGAWEKLGEQTLNVSDIVTTQQLNNAISNALSAYVTSDSLTQTLNNRFSQEKTAIMEDVAKNYATTASLEDYAKKTDLDSLASKDDLNGLATKAELEDYLTEDNASKMGWMTKDEIISNIQSTENGSIGTSIAITDDQIDDLTK